MRISSMSIRKVLFILTVILATFAGSCHHTNSSNGGGGGTTVSVLEHHNGPRRDGVYVSPTLTKASASTFHIDQTFNGVVPGAIYAQLLYFVSGPGGKNIVIAVTEENNVVALDAATGTAIWTRNLGTPVSLSQLPCGNIDPLGITGTPVIDPDSRTLFLDAMITSDNGITKKHLIFALSLDDGSTLSGWPVDASATVTFSGIAFDSSVQNQRGALVSVNGTVYVPYGGLAGDCGNYHGWIVGVPVANPAAPKAWVTGARGGGVWAPSGVASENGAVFIATGNTFSATTWAGGEALLRLNAGPVFSNLTTDYFTPSNWQALDAGDIDLGGTGPVILDVPGSTPVQLLIGLGKDGKIYLVDRNNLGGI